jgi:CDP-glycerol glycerophosphotransferase (TagB/SpsB family)/glycosyltransferase involved in cell wall biosynthesis
MKIILFCQNAYAFGIMSPLRNLLIDPKYEFLWYISKKLLDNFPFKGDNFTTSILELQWFHSDVIFVPGNEVPHYLRGLKVQIFHGLAGEKKGHFRIRHYFDLYLTQGPYFTKKFNELKQEHRNFDVIETGWPKLDALAKNHEYYQAEKEQILEKHKAKKLILYAPTFSPSLTSAPHLIDEIKKLAQNTKYLIYVKFHDLMSKEALDRYDELQNQVPNVLVKNEKNIVKFLVQADILISDTSSVIYEFLLLGKPVISYKNIADNIQWDNATTYSNLTEKVAKNLEEDPFKLQREKIIQEYHPYNDGKSAERMLRVVKNYIIEKGVPERRPLRLFRRLKIYALFGKPIKPIWKGKQKNKISALFITFNEAKNIVAVLENVGFADEIIVVDSNSTDGTPEKIKQFPKVKLIQRAFKNFTDQKSFALEQASNEWVLFLDADERIPDKLKNEIVKEVNSEEKDTASAYFFRRTFMFKNSVLRFSGWQSDKNYRLFKKSKVKFDIERTVHETLIIDGKSKILKNKLTHYSYDNYEKYKQKMLRYGTMKAHDEFKKGKKARWYHFIIRPAFKFFNHFILRLGFLDGIKGITISYLNALGVLQRYKELKKLTTATKN